MLFGGGPDDRCFLFPALVERSPPPLERSPPPLEREFVVVVAVSNNPPNELEEEKLPRFGERDDGLLPLPRVVGLLSPLIPSPPPPALPFPLPSESVRMWLFFFMGLLVIDETLRFGLDGFRFCFSKNV